MKEVEQSAEHVKLTSRAFTSQLRAVSALWCCVPARLNSSRFELPRVCRTVLRWRCHASAGVNAGWTATQGRELACLAIMLHAKLNRWLVRNVVDPHGSRRVWNQATNGSFGTLFTLCLVTPRRLRYRQRSVPFISQLEK